MKVFAIGEKYILFYFLLYGSENQFNKSLFLHLEIRIIKVSRHPMNISNNCNVICNFIDNL